MHHTIKNIIMYFLIVFFMYVILFRETTVEGWLRKQGRDAGDAVSGGADTIVSGVSGVAGGVSGVAGGVSAGGSIITGGITKGKSAADKLIDDAKQKAIDDARAAQKLIDDAKQKLIDEAGAAQKLIDDAKQKLIDEAEAARRAAEDAANKAALAWNTVADFTTEIYGDVIGTITGLLGDTLDDLLRGVNGLNTVLNSSTQNLDNVANISANFQSNIINGIK